MSENHKREHIQDIYSNIGLAHCVFFALSSHKRAKHAIDFALQMRQFHYHSLIIGEAKSGRMTSTLSYLKAYAEKMPAPGDWIYLKNFKKENAPIPFSIPAGEGALLSNALKEFIYNVKTIINKTVHSGAYIKIVEDIATQVQYNIDKEFKALADFADKKGFHLLQTPEDINVEHNEDAEHFSAKDLKAIRENLAKTSLNASLSTQKANRKINAFKQKIIKKNITPIWKEFKKLYLNYLGSWLDDLLVDILGNIDLFFDVDSAIQTQNDQETLQRYAVNLFVDNAQTKHPVVHLEANPDFDTLFGSIEYANTPNQGLETNFTMMKAGALHKANGGYLIIRAEDILKNPELWEDFKIALRDKEIHIHEKYRDNSPPLLDRPQPIAIPLKVQIFLVASPSLYYQIIQSDPDFFSYFQVKAEIDPDMPATASNIQAYQKLLTTFAHHFFKKGITKTALTYLMNRASREAHHKNRLTAHFEGLVQLIEESVAFRANHLSLDKETIQKVLDARHQRHCRIEDHTLCEIKNGVVMIDTKNERIGQINALTILNVGDNEFGVPSKISAQTYAGMDGVVNIEHQTEMAGPIQQKSALILEGYLKGTFAQDFPLCCGASLTFEQSYGGVDGDSASMAELIVILSSLAQQPIRQEIAITGSMNQFGEAQAVGSVHIKIEGYYRVCLETGLTGGQGVIIPKANLNNLTLRPAIQRALDAKQFHIYSVSNVIEAMNILMMPYFDKNKLKDFYQTTVFPKIYHKLMQYHQILKPHFKH